MQVREKKVICYNEYIGHRPSSLRIKLAENMQLQQKKIYSGMISVGCKKRMTRAITLLIESAEEKRIYNPVAGYYQKHKLSFITLTVSDSTKNITAGEAYTKLLQHFLQWLRRTKKVTTYIWKAELQERGQIHYHITTPSFIIHSEIKDKWNNLQREQGLLSDFYNKYGHYNPNSTDIHSVKKINDLAAYLIKYFTKAYQNEKSVGGKVWDCSNNIKKWKYFNVVQNQFNEEFLMMCVDNDAASLYVGDNYRIYKFAEKPHRYLLTQEQFEEYNNHLITLRTEQNATLPITAIENITPIKIQMPVSVSEKQFKLYEDISEAIHQQQ